MDKRILTPPFEYPVCIHADCPMAGSCLRFTTIQQYQQKQEYLRLINPDKCRKNSSCPYYRNAEPVRFAFGFTKIQARMFPDQYKAFMYRLVGVWGRKLFYQYRNGSRPLPPSQQALVHATLNEIGVEHIPDFDGYTDSPNWFE